MKNNNASELSGVVTAVSSFVGEHCNACLVNDPKKPAVAFCKNCHENLCKGHVAYHQEKKVYHDHELEFLPETTADTEPLVYEVTALKPSACPTHSNEKSVGFCRTCEKPMCGICCFTDHKGAEHETLSIEEMDESQSKTLLEIGVCSHKLTKALDDVAKTQENCDVNNLAYEQALLNSLEKDKQILEARFAANWQEKDKVYIF